MDTLREILEGLAAELESVGYELPPGLLDISEAIIRRDHGGKTLYIKRYPKRRAMLTGEPLGPLTQKELAQASGYSVRHIRRIQRGK